MDNITIDFPKEERHHIALIGLPFSGKTTIGAALSVLMNREWVDIDSLIEKKSGKTIQEIFEKDGETTFRKMEEEEISTALHVYPPMVISLGGGAYQNENTRNLCKSLAYVVWIRPSIETIMERIRKRNDNSRPLFKGKDPEEVLNALMKIRYENYIKSHIVVDINNQQRPQDIAIVIQAAYNNFINNL